MGSLYRDEIGGLVVLKPIFPKLEEKNTKCHRKVYDEVVACWGEALLCLFLESWICVLLGLLLHWHTGDGQALVR